MQSKEAIAEQWLGRILRTYACRTARFLAEEQDEFRNPIGHTFREALAILLDELFLGMDAGRITAALDAIMQIRAVQDVPPSRALEFLPQLKGILRLELPAPEMELLDSRIDEMALRGFDLYMKYREKTYEVRAGEARRRVYVLERVLGVGERNAWQERGGA